MGINSHHVDTIREQPVDNSGDKMNRFFIVRYRTRHRPRQKKHKSFQIHMI